ncbi:MAG TPA: dienelactone hydrolase family protein [Bradyrhizobium sp.]|nr:dienelactone hydrolase family protein [Bradyrhizobium sp.]
MHKITRRSALLGLALLPISARTAGAEAEQLAVATDEGDMTLSRFAASGAAKRPAVLLLHGRGGFEMKPAAYERHANALMAAGIDCYLVRYMTEGDTRILSSRPRPEREAHETARFEAWARRSSAAISAVLARPDSSGRIGLLGFSLGGYVAAATAVRDQRVTALAVLYGGMPDAMASDVKHLPPLLELHGEADRNVPLSEGERLVKLAKAAGAEAEQVTYPGKTHGFDFADTDPATFDAIGRVARFFGAHLGSA